MMWRYIVFTHHALWPRTYSIASPTIGSGASSARIAYPVKTPVILDGIVTRQAREGDRNAELQLYVGW
jgi:hypothetical protein